MTPAKDAELRRKYPLVYARPFLNAEPFRCGDGWFGLLDRLSAKLEALIAAEPEEDRRRCAACQVKEKFGGLRFYTYGPVSPDMAQAIAEAETESYHTCEMCGAPGTLQTRVWTATLCEACFITSLRLERPLEPLE